jgi:hypothetical protein
MTHTVWNTFNLQASTADCTGQGQCIRLSTIRPILTDDRGDGVLHDCYEPFTYASVPILSSVQNLTTSSYIRKSLYINLSEEPSLQNKLCHTGRFDECVWQRTTDNLLDKGRTVVGESTICFLEY